MKINIFLISVALSALILGFNTSCEKNTDCKLTIKTVDSAGLPVSNVAVKLFANVKTATGSSVEADLKAEGVSDGSGQSSYTFKLPAIMDIKAIKGTKSGVGIIKLEEGKAVDKTITVK